MMYQSSEIAVVSPDDDRLYDLVDFLDPRVSEQAWLDAHVDQLGPSPQVNRFSKPAGALSFDAVEVHGKSHQLTVALDGSLLAAICVGGWTPSDGPLRALGVRVPAGHGLLIAPGVWHSGVVAESDVDVMAAFRPRTLQDATDVYRLGESHEFVVR